MNLKSKLILLAAVPVVGLLVTLGAFYHRTLGLEATVHQVTTESAVFADLARTLQADVLEIQQLYTDTGAVRTEEALDANAAAVQNFKAEFAAGLAKFRMMYEREQDQVHLRETEALATAFDRFCDQGAVMATAYVKEGGAAGSAHMEEFDAAADILENSLNIFVQQQTEELNRVLRAAEAASHRTAQWALGGGFLLVVGTVLLAGRTIRSIIGPIQSIANQVGDSAGSVSASAAELNVASQTLAEGASEQAASLEETSASLEEIASMTKRSSSHADQGAQLGQQARAAADVGLTQLTALSGTLQGIKTAVGDMQVAVAETQASSQEISKIIKTIDEIAFQTNLLALNAAVEAARAGESGLGFAVVADEVRALAQRSAQAAKDTADKIEVAVQRSELGGTASAKVVQSLTEVEATAHGIEQAFTGIVGQIKTLDGLISEIAAASKEQTQGVSEVNSAVGQMDQVTQSNAAAAEENAAAAGTLNAQAQQLQDVVVGLNQIIHGRGTAGRPAAAAAVRSGMAAKSVPRDEISGAIGLRGRSASPQRSAKVPAGFANF